MLLRNRPHAAQRKAVDVFGQLLDRRRVMEIQPVQPFDDGFAMVIGGTLRDDAGRAVTDSSRLGCRPQQFGHDLCQDLVYRPSRLFHRQAQDRRRLDHFMGDQPQQVDGPIGPQQTAEQLPE